MRIRATVTKDGYVQGETYDVPEKVARKKIVRDEAEPATVAPANDREKAVIELYEKRNTWPIK